MATPSNPDSGNMMWITIAVIVIIAIILALVFFNPSPANTVTTATAAFDTPNAPTLEPGVNPTSDLGGGFDVTEDVTEEFTSEAGD